MAWEQRNGRIYFYRKRREGKRVVSEYLGSSEFVQAFADDLSFEQKVERERRQQVLSERQAREAMDRQLSDAAQLLRQATAELLRQAGFHQHKGTWRKQRHG